MQKLIIIFALIISSASIAQTYTSVNLPSPGDTIRISESQSVAGVSYTVTGAGQTWDFSGLIPFNQRLDTFASINSVSMIFQLAFNNIILYPNSQSNLVSPINIQGGQIGGGMSFFKKSTADYRQTGYGISMSGTDLPVPYNNPDIIYKFPLSASSPSDSCVAGYEIQIPGLGFMKQIKRRKNIVDGSGTLITPFGTFTDVIRVHSEIEQWDSISTDSSMALPGTTSFITEYKWLKAGFKTPLLEISESSLGLSISYIDIYRGINWFSTEEMTSGKGTLNVYPNPASEEVLVTLPEHFSASVYQVCLYSISGKLIYISKENSSNLLRLPIKDMNLSNGVYLLNIQNKQAQYTEKLIINN